MQRPEARASLKNGRLLAVLTGLEPDSRLNGARLANPLYPVERREHAGFFLPEFKPKPRNFTLGQFKCRSTPTGTLPTDEDLYNTIGRGLINSNMPQWLPLTTHEKVDLVAYVKHFSPRFAHGETWNFDQGSS